jgi:hypothetical protein
MLSPKIESTRGFSPKIKMKRKGIREILGTNLPRRDLEEIHSVRSGCPGCPHQLPLNPSCGVGEETYRRRRRIVHVYGFSPQIYK